MPGRGGAEDYVSEASKHAKEELKRFSGESDEVKAAAVAGVYSMYASNIVPTYVMDLGREYSH